MQTVHRTMQRSRWRRVVMTDVEADIDHCDRHRLGHRPAQVDRAAEADLMLRCCAQRRAWRRETKGILPPMCIQLYPQNRYKKKFVRT